jgi:hypothetical protein
MSTMIGRACPCHVDKTAAETGRVRVCLIESPGRCGSASVALGTQGWLSRATAGSAAKTAITTVNANNTTRTKASSVSARNRSYGADQESPLSGYRGPPCPRASSTPALTLAPRAHSDHRCRRRRNQWRFGDRRQDLYRERRSQRWRRSLNCSKELPAGVRNLPTRRLPQNERLAEDVEIWRASRYALRQVCPVSTAGNEERNVAAEIGERKMPAGGDPTKTLRTVI